MSSSSAERGQPLTECGVPTALLECLAAMRMGGEAAFEVEFADTATCDSGAAGEATE